MRHPEKITTVGLLSTLLMGAAVFACSPGVAEAHRPWNDSGHYHQPQPIPAQEVSVTLESPSGGSIQTFWHDGSLYAAGQNGARYNLRVHNSTGERVEAVVSVDGRDVVSGQLGNYKSQRGYVIEPYGSVVIEGFRQSLDQVAAFRFTDIGNSYSARRGSGQHVGVIGVAVFKEYQPRFRRSPPQPVPIATRPYYEPYGGDPGGYDYKRHEGAAGKAAAEAAGGLDHACQRRPPPRAAPPAATTTGPTRRRPAGGPGGRRPTPRPRPRRWPRRTAGRPGPRSTPTTRPTSARAPGRPAATGSAPSTASRPTARSARSASPASTSAAPTRS